MCRDYLVILTVLLCRVECLLEFLLIRVQNNQPLLVHNDKHLDIQQAPHDNHQHIYYSIHQNLGNKINRKH